MRPVSGGCGRTGRLRSEIGREGEEVAYRGPVEIQSPTCGEGEAGFGVWVSTIHSKETHGKYGVKG